MGPPKQNVVQQATCTRIVKIDQLSYLQNNLLIGSPISRSLALTEASSVGTVIARAYNKRPSQLFYYILSLKRIPH